MQFEWEIPHAIAKNSDLTVQPATASPASSSQAMGHKGIKEQRLEGGKHITKHITNASLRRRQGAAPGEPVKVLMPCMIKKHLLVDTAEDRFFTLSSCRISQFLEMMVLSVCCCQAHVNPWKCEISCQTQRLWKSADLQGCQHSSLPDTECLNLHCIHQCKWHYLV